MRRWPLYLITMLLSYGMDSTLEAALNAYVSPSGSVLSNRPKKAFGQVQAAFNSEMVMETIGQCLRYIREDQLGNAYWKTTSNGYRHCTPWENFWYFVQEFPKLQEPLSLEMENITFKDGHAFFIAYLLSDENTRVFYLEAHLELERGQWKIMGMRLVELAEGQSSDSKEIQWVS